MGAAGDRGFVWGGGLGGTNTIIILVLIDLGKASGTAFAVLLEWGRSAFNPSAASSFAGGSGGRGTVRGGEVDGAMDRGGQNAWSR